MLQETLIVGAAFTAYSYYEEKGIVNADTTSALLWATALYYSLALMYHTKNNPRGATSPTVSTLVHRGGIVLLILSCVLLVTGELTLLSDSSRLNMYVGLAGLTAAVLQGVIIIDQSNEHTEAEWQVQRMAVEIANAVRLRPKTVYFHAVGGMVRNLKTSGFDPFGWSTKAVNMLNLLQDAVPDNVRFEEVDLPHFLRLLPKQKHVCLNTNEVGQQPSGNIEAGKAIPIAPGWELTMVWPN